MFHENVLSRINLWTDNWINKIEYKSFHNFTHTVDEWYWSVIIITVFFCEPLLTSNPVSTLTTSISEKKLY